MPTVEEIEMSIHAVAVEICRTDPDPESAATKLRRKLHPRRDELAEELYSAAILHAVHVARSALMRQVKASAASGSRVVAGAAAGSAAFDRSFLASWQTPDGRWLRDVTGTDCTEFAAVEREQANGHARVARFYAALATKVGAAKVGEVLDDEKAKQLWNNSGKAITGAKASPPHASRFQTVNA